MEENEMETQGIANAVKKVSPEKRKEIYEKVKKHIDTSPAKAHNILVRELGISSAKADAIVSQLGGGKAKSRTGKTNFPSFELVEKLVANLSAPFDANEDKHVQQGEIKESMDDLCEALEDEIIDSSLNDDIKKNLLAKLRRFSTTKTNIMLVGATGSGKSSTINALFSVNTDVPADSDETDYHYVEVAKVGTKSDPETKVIEKYTIGNLTLWDTPGLGDSTEEDASHMKVIRDLLRETDDEGDALIDLVLVIVDGSTRDLGTSYQILNEVILPELEDETDRVLVALNQADIAMKTGRHWNYDKNEPDETLIAFLEDKVRSIHDRVLEDTGVEVEPIYYCAGYMEEETGEVIRPYNLSKLLFYIMNAIPPFKRVAVLEGINTDSENYEYNDDDEDYNEGVQSSFYGSFEDIVDESVEGGIDLGFAILGVPGAVVGGVLGAAVGVVKGLLGKLFG